MPENSKIQASRLKIIYHFYFYLNFVNTGFKVVLLILHIPHIMKNLTISEFYKYKSVELCKLDG